MGDWAEMYDHDHENPEAEEDINLVGCTLVHETEKAWLIRQLRRKSYRQAWFPKSQCGWYPTQGVLIHPAWLDPSWTTVTENKAPSLFTKIAGLEPAKDIL